MLWAGSYKITEIDYILGLLYPRLRFCINSDQKWVEEHFGRFFHKLIRSS
jgi:hypothetical protein